MPVYNRICVNWSSRLSVPKVIKKAFGMGKALGEGKEKKMYAGWEPTLNFIVITSQMGYPETRGMRVCVLQVQQQGSYLRGHGTERLSN